jgi:hypothetical protein
LTKTSVLRAIQGVFLIMARARAAERLYVELSRECDTDLAKKGLKRTDLPCATFIALTKGY